MRRLNINKVKWNYLAIAFVLPFGGMLIYMVCAELTPFGDFAMLYSDEYHQYFPFFREFHRHIRSGQSVLYTWSVGMGLDYLGIVSYYLASPLNLLSIALPEAWLLDYFSLLIPIRLGLASLFFALLLKNIFQKDDLSIAIFGSFYGLCAWALGYQWNIMWLDSFALLPLVAWGTISLLKAKKFVLYTTSLFLAILANYYIGYFVCIFVLLVFVCYEISRFQGFKRFLQDLGRIALFSILAIGMTAILELPAYAALQNTAPQKIEPFVTEEGFQRLNIVKEYNWRGLFEAMRQVAGNMNGKLSPTFKEGLPNLHCGVVGGFLAALYLMMPGVRVRDKICAVLLLLFFNLSFVIRRLDYIWHGFHFPNMIPYRFSFLYSFVILFMAFQAWIHRDKCKVWQLLLAAVLSCGLILCYGEKTETGTINRDTGVLAYNFGLLAAYLVIMLAGKIRRPLPGNARQEQIQEAAHFESVKRCCVTVLMLSIMALELVLIVVNFALCYTMNETGADLRINLSYYPKDPDHAASVIRYMHEREDNTPFFRAETTHSQTLNDGALNGYNGISTFTSSANVQTTEFIKALGFAGQDNYNRYCYEESSPVANLFLGLKYMIEREGRDRASQYFSEINRYGDTILLENNAYLPLGFLANRELAQVDMFSGDVFDVQNSLFAASTGIQEDVWYWNTHNQPEISGDGLMVQNKTSTGYCEYFGTGTLVYSYQVDRDGFMCVDLDLPYRNNVSIWHNGRQLYSETMSLPQTLAVCDVAVGDNVEVHLTCDRSGYATVAANILNAEVFWQGYHILNASTLELTNFDTTRVEGRIVCDREGLLYTSIPQNGYWSVEVDGVPANIELVGDTMIAVELTAGEHTVVYWYRNSAFSLGWKISLISLAVFAVLVWIFRKEQIGKLLDRMKKK